MKGRSSKKRASTSAGAMTMRPGASKERSTLVTMMTSSPRLRKRLPKPRVMVVEARRVVALVA
jgi:hypothetical protein